MGRIEGRESGAGEKLWKTVLPPKTNLGTIHGSVVHDGKMRHPDRAPVNHSFPDLLKVSQQHPPPPPWITKTYMKMIHKTLAVEKCCFPLPSPSLFPHLSHLLVGRLSFQVADCRQKACQLSISKARRSGKHSLQQMGPLPTLQVGP